MENTANELQTTAPQLSARKKHAKLSLADHALIVRCHLNNPGLSQNKIAELLHVDQRTVSKALKYADVKAADLLQVAEKHAAQQWVRSIRPAAMKGDHKPARDLLLHTRAIDPVEKDGGTAINIVIGGGVIPGISIESRQTRDVPKEIANKSGDSVIDVSGT